MPERIKKFLSPPVFEDEEQARMARLLNTVLLLLLAMTVVGTAITILLEPEEYVVNLTLAAVLIVVLLWLRRIAGRGQIRVVGGLLAATLWFVFTFLVWSNNGLRNPAIAGYVLVVILAAFLAGEYAGFISAGFSILAVSAAIFGEQWGLIPAVTTRTANMLDLVTLGTILVLAASLLDFEVRSVNRGFALARANALAQADANRRLRAIQATLEQRVMERTHALERRSEQLRAAAEIGRAAMGRHDVGELLQYLVEAVRERFGLRYAALYLVDEQGKAAVLRAISAQDAQWLPAPGTRFTVGGQHPVGYVTRFGESRLVELPGGAPKAYIPLVSGQKMLGVLEMQGPLEQQDIPILRILADWSATAIENARLLSETRATLEATRWAYEESSSRAWAELLRTRSGIGYVCDYLGDVRPVRPQERISHWPEAQAALSDGQMVQADASTVFIPLQVRGRPLGVLRLRKPEEIGRWTAEDLALLETMVEQLGVALESARLYQATQRNAARERLVSEVAGKLRATLDPDAILKTTVRELGRALGAEQAVVEITGPILEAGTPADSTEEVVTANLNRTKR